MRRTLAHFAPLRHSLAQAFVRFVMPLAAAKKLAATQRASKAALQPLMAEETTVAAQTAA